MRGKERYDHCQCCHHHMLNAGPDPLLCENCKATHADLRRELEELKAWKSDQGQRALRDQAELDRLTKEASELRAALREIAEKHYDEAFASNAAWAFQRIARKALDLDKPKENHG